MSKHDNFRGRRKFEALAALSVVVFLGNLVQGALVIDTFPTDGGPTNGWLGTTQTITGPAAPNTILTAIRCRAQSARAALSGRFEGRAIQERATSSSTTRWVWQPVIAVDGRTSAARWGRSRPAGDHDRRSDVPAVERGLDDELERFIPAIVGRATGR